MDSAPGSLKGVQLNVEDVGVVHALLRERGVEVSDIQEYPRGRFCFFFALAVSVDGYITGRDPGPGRASVMQGCCSTGTSTVTYRARVFDGFQLSEPSARVFDAVAGRVGVSLAGRNTYDDSGWINGGAPHPTAPLFVLSQHVRLRLVEAVSAPGVTHPHYEVAR